MTQGTMQSLGHAGVVVVATGATVLFWARATVEIRASVAKIFLIFSGER